MVAPGKRWVIIAVMTPLLSWAAAVEAPGGDVASLGTRCQALLGISRFATSVPDARIVKASSEAQSPPAHCLVEGVLRERKGSDGQSYAVRFRLRLPLNWNGRFLFQGGGGTNGFVGNALGPLLQEKGPTALDQGFAVVATDSGHDNQLNFDPHRAGMMAFGFDFAAREELADAAGNSVADAAKALVALFYGEPPHKSYFFGCSNGGREGLVFAQRYPSQFDGIYAAAPAMSVPRAAIAIGSQMQALAAVAREAGLADAQGLPDLGRSFSSKDLSIAADAIREACDAGDGLRDGLVQDFRGCTARRVRPALARRTCTSAKRDGCLSRPQVAAFVSIISGVRTRKGKSIYAPYPWDLGVGGSDWRGWKLGGEGAPSLGVTLVMPGLAAVFMTPPDSLDAGESSAIRYMLAMDTDRSVAGITRTSAEFPRSSWTQFSSTAADLDAFRARGGKMIIPHGAADGVFSIHDTVAWWLKVDRRAAGKAADFARVFNVPGAGHCFPGDSVDQFDGLNAVVRWVEERDPPDRIVATAGSRSPWPGRTRPLCPYPSVARYRGGDPESAASFSCRS